MTQEMKIINPSAEDLNVNSEATVEELTLEIQYYFVQMGQNTIEIGKRLIMVKAKLQHGNWENWLRENFDLSQDTATNFMNVAKRFGANSETSRNLKFSQMVEMLRLPVGDEEKFIEEKSVEGTPVEKMTVKQLRAAVKKYNDKLVTASGKVLSFVPVKETATVETALEEETANNLEEKHPVEEILSPVSIEPAENLIEKPVVPEKISSDESSTTNENEVAQFLKLIPALLNKGNLQELITNCAVQDAPNFEQQLQQLAVLSAELQKGLEKVREKNAVQTESAENIIPVEENSIEENSVEENPVEEKASTTPESTETVNSAETAEKTVEVEKVESESAVTPVEKEKPDEDERAEIILELQQVALNDDDKFTKSKQIRKLIEELGADTVNQLKTPELRKILKAVKIDKGGGVQNENISDRP